MFASDAPCGTFSSSTMIVMMIAITPSLNASNLPFPISSLFVLDAFRFYWFFKVLRGSSRFYAF